jgi:predicted RNA binding protein YcfA (HicA-like mRNA interferase family)
MKSNELLRLLLKGGWVIKRQSGSHMVLEHPLKKEKVVFPTHGSKEVGKGLELKIRKLAGLK